MADEAKKATSQVDEAERRLRDKTKEVSALQTQLSEMTDRVQVSLLYNRIDLNVMVEGCTEGSQREQASLGFIEGFTNKL